VFLAQRVEDAIGFFRIFFGILHQGGPGMLFCDPRVGVKPGGLKKFGYF
jgi:hypothetical protein